MSTYTEFYLGNKRTKDFISLFHFTASHPVSRFFNSIAPYNDMKKLTKGDLENYRVLCEEEIEDYEDSYIKIDERRNLVAGMNNTIAEKMEQIYELDAEKSEIIQEVEDLKTVKGALGFMLWILEDDISNVLWCGCEVEREKIGEVRAHF